jgi:alpha-tubulin suppressor-like RCC1 family protein
MLKDNSIRNKRTYTTYTHNYGLMGAGNSTFGSLDSDIIVYFLSEIDSTGNIVYTSGSSDNIFYIKSDGTLWGVGGNANGRLGDGTTFTRNSFVPIGSLTNWSKVYSGIGHTIGLKTDGTLWSWGGNTQGELGLNNITTYSSPMQIGTLNNWLSAASGNTYSVATKTDGTLWGWGANDLGQLGNSESNFSFININEDLNWSTGDNGYSHTMAIKTTGTLWGWGVNTNGQLGNGNSTNQSSPVQIGTLFNWLKVYANRLSSASIKTDGTLWVWGNNSNGQLGTNNTTQYSSPVQVGTLSDWDHLSLGELHTLGIKTNGSLWGWGNNASGQLGDEQSPYSAVKIEDISTNWDKVSSGASHTIAIKSTGTLWVWGTNSNGQLGNGNTTSQSSPVQVGTRSDWSKVYAGNIQSFAIRNDGTLWAWGNNSNGRLGTNNQTNYSSPVQVGTLGDWSFISSYTSYTMAIKTNGTLWGWGANTYGNLGTNNTTQYSSPVQVGTLGDWSSVSTGLYHTMATKTNGTLWAVGGYNDSGQHGTNNIFTQISSPVQVGTDTNWSKVYSSDYHTLAIKTDNSLWAWGRGTEGQLGNNASTAYIFPLNDVSEFSISNGYTAHIVRSSGTLWGWGSSFYGGVGNGAVNTNVSSPVQIGTLSNWSKVSDGIEHTMAIKIDGTLWGWGRGDSGQLGNGTNTNNSSPVQIGTLSNWSQVSAGSSYTMAIKTDGTLWGWGYNGVANLGTGSYSNTSSPVQVGTQTNWSYVSASDISGHPHTFGIKTDGTIWVWGSNLYGGSGYSWGSPDFYIMSPKQLGSETNWSKIFQNDQNTIGIKTDGSIWGWGTNNNYQLGLGDTVQRVSPTQIGTQTNWSKIDVGITHSLAIKTDGTLWGWGNNNNNQLTSNIPFGFASLPTQIGTQTNWSDVVAGNSISLLKDTSNAIFSTGIDTSGQMGIGNLYSSINRSSPIQVGLLNGNVWSSASAGNSYSMAIKTDGTLWGWGNSGSYFGRGPDSISRSSPVQIGNQNYWTTISINGVRNVALLSPVGSGLIYTFSGSNSFLGWTSDKSSPVQIGTQTNWSKVIAHIYGGFALKNDGTLWSWGQNQNGILGNNSSTSYDSPVQIGTQTYWSSLAKTKAFYQMFAIKTDGTLWGWGYNTYGGLGQNNQTNYSSPVQVGTDANWSKVSNGHLYTMAIKTDNSLWGWGYNELGQLGLRNSINRSSPVQIDSKNNYNEVFTGSSHTININNLNQLSITGANNSPLILGKSLTKSSPIQIGTLTNWSKVFTKNKTTIAIKTDGTLWGWGDNQFGAIGNSTYTLQNSPVQIGTQTNWSNASVDLTTMAIKTDGTLWGWGLNTNGQIGNVANNLFGVGYAQTTGGWVEYANGQQGYELAIKTDGTLWGWGYNTGAHLGLNENGNRSSPVQIGTLSNWSKVYSSINITNHVIKTDGTLWGWGQNNYNQVGDGTSSQRNSPVQIGTHTNWSKIFHAGTYGTFAIKTNNTLWSWGYNINYYLGQPGNYNSYTSPVQVGTLSIWSKASSYDSHSLFLSTTNKIWSVGTNDNGQLGLNNNNTYFVLTQIGSDDWTDIAAGQGFSIAVKSSGTLWGWGNTSVGIMGDGNDSYTRNILAPESEWSNQFSVSETHGIAVKTDGTLWSWGNNTNGQLGTSNTTTYFSPVQVGTLTDWDSVEAGAFYSMATKTNGTLWSWGNNSNGQLGTSNTTNYSSPVQVGTLTDWDKIYPTKQLYTDYNTFAIKTNGTLWAWGYSQNGSYGDSSFTTRSSPVQIGTNVNWSKAANGPSHTMAIKTDGTLWGWGYNQNYQLGTGNTSYAHSSVQIGTNVNWSHVSTNALYTMAVTTNGTLWGWGYNQYYGAGNPNWFAQLVSPIQVGSDNDWSKVEVASTSSFALKTNGTLWGWGYDQNLGLSGDGTFGTNLYRSAPTQISSEYGWSELKVSASASMVFRSNTIYTAGGSPQNGRMAKYSSPVQIGTLSNWSKVYVNSNSIFAFKTDNTLWVWGADANGKFGLGVTDKIFNSPTQTASDINLDGSLSVNDVHLYVRGADGLLYYSGNNTFASRGALDLSNFNFPLQIGKNTNWSDVVTVASSTIAIRNNGTIWSWGGNSFNLGDGSNISKSSPVQIGNQSNWSGVDMTANSSFARNTSGKLYSTSLGMVYGKSSPIQVTNATNWDSFSAGVYTAHGIKTNGTLWGWGHNGNGEIGDSTSINKGSPVQIGTHANWSKVSAGMSFVMAIKNDGTLWGWGLNNSGQLGNNTTITRSSPVQVGVESNWSQVSAGTSHTMAIKTNGTLWGWGSNSGTQIGDSSFSSKSSPVQIGTLSNWSQVSSGVSATMAIKTDGTLWSWGYNLFNLMGFSSVNYFISPVQVGTDTNWSKVAIGAQTTIAIKSDKTLWAWGSNRINNGTPLGIFVSTSNPSFVNTNNLYKEISAGQSFSMAIATNGTLWGWGVNSSGQLGNGNLTTQSSPVQIGTLSNWSKVASGDSFSVSIKTDGTLWAWGVQNSYGELGDNTTTNRSSPVQIGTLSNWSQISAGIDHMVSLKTDGTLWTWGSNINGQLGHNLPTTSHRSSPVQLGTLNDWSKVFAGENHTLAVKTDGTLWSWGSNSNGQLGQNRATNAPLSSPVQVGTLRDWLNIAAGGNYSIAVKTNGTLWGWGANSSGNLGTSNTTQHSSPVQVGTLTNWLKVYTGENSSGQSTLAIKRDGTLWAWGLNTSGQLGIGTNTTISSPVQIGTRIDWLSVAVGQTHTVFMDIPGYVYTAGSTTSGQLGYFTEFNSSTDFSSPIQIGYWTQWDKISNSITASQTMFAIKNNGTLWSWGQNSGGILGDNSIITRSSPVQIGNYDYWEDISVGGNFFIGKTKY